jgi:iron complex transport system permease protein
MNKKTKYIVIFFVLLILLFLSALLSIMVGSTNVFNKNMLQQSDILLGLRLPRILLALIVGGSLSLSGAILQGIFKNPLVEPYTLGISGGANLFVCIGIAFNVTRLFEFNFIQPLTGFAGALLSIMLVYFLSKSKKELKINGMLLIGVMFSFISSSLVMLIIALSKSESAHSMIFWMMGSLDKSDPVLTTIVGIVAFMGLIISLFFSIALNAMSLGEEEAIKLGINTVISKKFLFLITSLLTGLSVSVAGNIGFVGLIIPHFMRLIVSNDNRILLIASFITGAMFLILCDTLARTILFPIGLELPVGVITGIIGGILMIFLLTKKKVKT